jgi:hypothetical protein
MLCLPAVPANRARLLGSSCVGMVVAVACAVFPDEAVLPGSISVAGAGGELPHPSSGEAGQTGPGGVTQAGGVGVGGAPVVVMAGAGAGGTEGVPNSAGAGGAASECASSSQTVVPVTVDLWVDSAEVQANHGKDAALYVVKGAEERRAMFQLELPAAMPGATLLSAALTMRLASNAGATLTERRLGLHRLAFELSEDKTSWKNYGPGNKEWQAGGGDFGPRWATLTVPAGTNSASLTFDVTSEIRNLPLTSALALAMVVLEIDPAPSAPAELAIVATEGNASQAAKLTLTYCEP